MDLRYKSSLSYRPFAPFNFEGTVFNPSHFPTPTEIFENGKWWQTMRFEDKILGLKMENLGSTTKPKIKLIIYSLMPLGKDLIGRVIKEIKYRFELDLNLSEFNQKLKDDKVLGPVIHRRLGMRSKCGYSLYESWWGKYKRLAAFYLWVDLFWQHKQKPIPWLAKEIRL